MNRDTSPSSSSVAFIPIIIAGALIILGGFLISRLAPSVLPPEASAQAQQVDRLFEILLMIGGAVFLLVQGLLVYSVIRFRAKPGDTSDGPAIHGNATLELIWTAIPSVIVLVLVILSYQVWVDMRTFPANENLVNGQAVPLSATGQRFAWSFSYASPEVDKDGNPITINSNVLHTYVGQNVRLSMTTSDVIHAFWVPAMRIKQDLIPGRITEIHFTPTQAGEFPVRCAELCGSGHGQMTATIVVHPDETAYLSAFYDAAIDRVLNPPADPALFGEQLLSSGKYPCASCHVLDTFGWTGNTGPSLNGIGDRASRRIPGYSAEDYLLESLYDPHAYLVPGFGALMPVFQGSDPNAPNYMPETDHHAIVAYLCTLTADGSRACEIDPALAGLSGAAAEATVEPGAEMTPEAAPMAEAAQPAESAEPTAEATP